MNFLRNSNNDTVFDSAPLRFDLDKLDQEINDGTDDVSLQIKEKIQNTLPKINKKKCFDALRKYYQANGHFPDKDQHYTWYPEDCVQRIDAPESYLESRYKSFGSDLKDVNAGVYIDKNGYGGSWRVYLDYHYFEHSPQSHNRKKIE